MQETGAAELPPSRSGLRVYSAFRCGASQECLRRVLRRCPRQCARASAHARAAYEGEKTSVRFLRALFVRLRIHQGIEVAGVVGPKTNHPAGAVRVLIDHAGVRVKLAIDGSNLAGERSVEIGD